MIFSHTKALSSIIYNFNKKIKSNSENSPETSEHIERITGRQRERCAHLNLQRTARPSHRLPRYSRQYQQELCRQDLRCCLPVSTASQACPNRLCTPKFR